MKTNSTNYLPYTLFAPFLAALDRLCPDPQIRLAVRLMLTMGLRICDVCNLEWRQFSDRAMTLLNLSGGTGRVYHMPVPEDLTRWLSQWRLEAEARALGAGYQLPGTVFFNYLGKPKHYPFTRNYIHRALREIGWDGCFDVQLLRRSYIAHAAQRQLLDPLHFWCVYKTGPFFRYVSTNNAPPSWVAYCEMIRRQAQMGGGSAWRARAMQYTPKRPLTPRFVVLKLSRLRLFRLFIRRLSQCRN